MLSYVNNVGIITELQVMEDGSLREVTKLSAILDTIELDGIHAMNLLSIKNLLLRG